MIKVVNKCDCCGCGACFDNCPKKAIELYQDNEGFFYPRIDEKKCIGCKLCDKVCPMHNNESSEDLVGSSTLYYAQHNDIEVRKASTSGGVFTAIANYVIEHNGVVVGAGFNDKLEVVHKVALTVEELAEFRGSKYVQSSMVNIYQSVREFLEKGLLVFFTGTPCQVSAVKNVFPNNNNLLTMDFLCLGVSSPGLYGNWVKYLSQKYSRKVKKIEFRNKDFGYSVSNVKVTFDDDKYINQKYDSKAHIKTFFDYYNVRPACYACEFREWPRVSDFTAGDHIGNWMTSEIQCDDTGVSRLWVHTVRGENIFHQIEGQLSYEIVESGLLPIVGGDRGQIIWPSDREQFFNDSVELDYEKWIEKWVPKSLKSSIVSLLRVCLKGSSVGTKIFVKMRRYQAKRFDSSIHSK